MSNKTLSMTQLANELTKSSPSKDSLRYDTIDLTELSELSKVLSNNLSSLLSYPAFLRYTVPLLCKNQEIAIRMKNEWQLITLVNLNRKIYIISKRLKHNTMLDQNVYVYLLFFITFYPSSLQFVTEVGNYFNAYNPSKSF